MEKASTCWGHNAEVQQTPMGSLKQVEHVLRLQILHEAQSLSVHACCLVGDRKYARPNTLISHDIRGIQLVALRAGLAIELL